MNTGDTAFVLISAAMVMLMTAGIGPILRGSRSKNALGTIMGSFVSLGLVSIIWILWGYRLSFGAKAFFSGMRCRLVFRPSAWRPQLSSVLS